MKVILVKRVHIPVDLYWKNISKKKNTSSSQNHILAIAGFCLYCLFSVCLFFPPRLNVELRMCFIWVDEHIYAGVDAFQVYHIYNMSVLKL